MSNDKKDFIKVAVMGDYESVLPFQAIGVITVVPENFSKEGISSALMNLSSQKVDLLFLTEEIFKANSEYVEDLALGNDMNIIPIPNVTGSGGYGLTMVRKSVERAVGMDIFAVK